MNILFLSINFNIKSSNIYSDLIRELHSKGNKIYSVSSTERRNKEKTVLYVEEDINILKVKTLNIQKVNKIEKGISTILLEKQFIKAINRYFSNIKFDLVISTTPPITFEKVVNYIKKRDNAKSYLLLKDIFPQNAVDIGIINKNGLIYKFFRKKEKSLYLNSDFIGCMSEANRKYILKNNSYLEKEKIEVCPNSIKIKEKVEVDEVYKKNIKEKFGINKNAILLTYGGNLGKPQGLDFLIEVLRSNKENKDIHFLIIGNGTEFKKIQNVFQEENFKNATLRSALPKNEYENLVKCSDIGLIFLDKRFTIPNFPSRLLSYMEYSLPVIAATDINTDVGEAITTGDFGYWCESGDLNSFNKILKDIILNKELLNVKGLNSRKFLEENYTVDKCANIILNHFDKRL